jgi:hypothetical protein
MNDAGARYARGLRRYLTLAGLAWEWKDDMTEQGWLASEDPARMLAHLCWEEGAEARRVKDTCPSDRRLRLFACALCRAAWPLPTDEGCRLALDVAERYADGLVTEADRGRAHAEACRRAAVPGTSRLPPLLLRTPKIFDACALSQILDGTRGVGLAPAAQAALLRDIVGNPFRPVTLPAPPVTCLECGGSGRVAVPDPPGVVTSFRGKTQPCPCCKGGRVPGPCPWLTPTVRCLALAAYLERDRPCPMCRGKGRLFSCLGKGSLYWGEGNCGTCRGSGRVTDGMLDPARLAVLADALEEVGCEDEQILAHLRGPGPHSRGCWVVDMLLGKL